MKFLYLALGGATGTILRYIISGLVYRFYDGFFPWGTFAVNLSGSFVIGFLWESFERVSVSPNLRLFLLIGMLGAFTTFSTYSLESFNLLRDGEMRLALFNILLSNIVCIASVFLGFGASVYVFTHLR